MKGLCYQIPPLTLLGTELEAILNDHKESEDFLCAIDDCLYATNLGVTALEEHINMWTATTWDDKEYIRGITFVEQQWHQITGMF
jgi:hypothetical protein